MAWVTFVRIMAKAHQSLFGEKGNASRIPAKSSSSGDLAKVLLRAAAMGAQDEGIEGEDDEDEQPIKKYRVGM